MYKVLIDYGKPFEEFAGNELELKSLLKDLYIKSRDMAYCDILVFNEAGLDITESQFVEEIIRDVLEGVD